MKCNILECDEDLILYGRVWLCPVHDKKLIEEVQE